MEHTDIIIIGAGAAGLMAAKILSEKGRQVTVLEAQSRLGGRIHTFYDEQFAMPIELGAEFIHGNLPVTKKLLKEAGITYHQTGGEWWQVKEGELKEEEQAIDHWNLFEKKLKKLEHDMTLNAFLEEYFPEDKYAGMRRSARDYASGYDTADPATASIFALREEWIDTEEEPNYRPDTCYQPMINYMAATIKQHSGNIYTNTVAKEIKWQQGAATVICVDGTTYSADKVIITLSVGMLQAAAAEQGAITISPAVPDITAAINSMGMGAVIKVLLQFKEAFWENKEYTKHIDKDLSELGFMLSEEAIPTWWTLFPQRTTLLTGWLGGPAARALKDTPDEDILQIAINSLTNIFKLPPATITQLISTGKIMNWNNEVYARGSYSFVTVPAKAARAVLAKGIADTIYFAGEAMDDTPVMGTVEAALSSGQTVAKLLLNT